MKRLTPYTICGFWDWRHVWRFRFETLPSDGDGWVRRIWLLGPLYLSFSIAIVDGTN